MKFPNVQQVTPEHAEARKCWRKAAEQGLAPAQQILNTLNPSSEVQIISDMVDLLKSRAKKGDAEAQFNLDIMYANGEVVT